MRPITLRRRNAAGRFDYYGIARLRVAVAADLLVGRLSATAEQELGRYDCDRYSRP